MSWLLLMIDDDSDGEHEDDDQTDTVVYFWEVCWVVILILNLSEIISTTSLFRQSVNYLCSLFDCSLAAIFCYHVISVTVSLV